MKKSHLFLGLIIVVGASLPLGGHAAQISIGANGLGSGDINIPLGGSPNVLQSDPNSNGDLTNGEYGFAQVHTPASSSYFDEWQFSLGQNSNVSISLQDVEVSLEASFPTISNGQLSGTNSSIDLIGSKFLTFSLFDHTGKLISTAGNQGELNALNLLAGQWYTLTVSAKESGIFGSAYYGVLSATAVAPVPLSDSLPFFSSALGILMLRKKQQLVRRLASLVNRG